MQHNSKQREDRQKTIVQQDTEDRQTEDRQTEDRQKTGNYKTTRQTKTNKQILTSHKKLANETASEARKRCSFSCSFRAANHVVTCSVQAVLFCCAHILTKSCTPVRKTCAFPARSGTPLSAANWKCVFATSLF